MSIPCGGVAGAGSAVPARSVPLAPWFWAPSQNRGSPKTARAPAGSEPFAPTAPVGCLCTLRWQKSPWFLLSPIVFAVLPLGWVQAHDGGQRMKLVVWEGLESRLL